jgi:glucose-6-phosphate 1-epimerase
MSDIESLRRQFAIPDVVELDAAKGGLTRINVRAPAADAHVYLHGAHVTHFQPAGQQPVLFLSDQSRFEPGKAIRGGVPIIFPWFGAKSDDPAAPMHGFARTVEWELMAVRQGAAGDVRLVLETRASDATRKLWPHEFILRYTVCVAKALELTLEVIAGSADLIFEEALHTYLALGDVRNASIEGLAERAYLDKTDGMRRKIQPAGPMVIGGETDRVYLDTSDTVRVNDASVKRRISIQKEGSASTVLWNPWIDKARSLADLGDAQWPRMLCVETANVTSDRIVLPAGTSHAMSASIALEG